MAKKEIHSTTKVIAVFCWMMGFLGFFLAMFAFMGAGASNLLTQGIMGMASSVYSTSMFIIVGILAMILGFLSLYTGVGLWSGKEWARIIAIVLLAIGIVFNIIGIFSATSMPLAGMMSLIPTIIWLAVYIFMVVFLCNKKTKKTFN